jgi:hypothetical protein
MAVGTKNAEAAPRNGGVAERAKAVTSGHRFAIGANVAIAILAAALLLVAVNWISSLKDYRHDLASVGNYGISERTKRIVSGQKAPIRLSLLFTPDDKDPKQQHYIDRLLDYCEELREFSPNVEVTHIATGSQREKLVTRMSSTFGGEAERHKNALIAFEKLRATLAADLEQRVAASRTLLAQDSWLGGFPLFAQVATKLESERKKTTEVAEEIAELTPEGGIPKYAEATSKAKQTLDEFKTDFEAIGQIMGQLTTLSEEMARPDSPYLSMLREVAPQAKQAMGSLRALVGNRGDPAPSDSAGVLKACADRVSEVSGILDGLVRRVDQFGEKFPMVRQHANWATQVQQGPLRMRVEVGGILEDASRGLGALRLRLLGAIDSGDAQQLKSALGEARKLTAHLTRNAQVCEQILSELTDRLDRLDSESRQVLDAARGGNLLKDQIEAIAGIQKQFEDLPELKLGSVADELKQDNAVVVEVGDKIRVVGFGATWPLRESVSGPRGATEELGRTFNGDSTLPSAILAMSSEQPFAEVVFVSFEPPAPQQRSPFMPAPPQSSISARGLGELRARLTAANYKNVEWNMATQKQEPPPVEGQDRIYLVLPPAPPAGPSPFGGPQPDAPVFGEEQRQVIRNLLDNDARMIFLTKWEVTGGGFGGPPHTPPYGYGPLLEEDWGIQVDNALRIVSVEPDLETANGFTVVLREFGHMPVTGFSDHPIGKPMRGTRFLVADACPLESMESRPDGVTTSVIAGVSKNERWIAVSVDEIMEIVDIVNNPKSGGVVELGRTPRHGPFDIMLTAERREGDQRKGRIVVVGFGGSLLNQYLTQPVLADAETVRLDPPPTENLDLFINALYWLDDKEAYIGRGPVPVPRVHAIAAAQLSRMRWFVWAIWPALVFVPGAILWYIRRR